MKNFLPVFLLFLSFTAYAQTRHVTGQVLDSRKKPLPGSKIVLTDSCAGKTFEAMSSDSGYFSLEIPAGCDNLWIYALHEEDCESAYGSYNRKLPPMGEKDTIRVWLANIYIDYNLPGYEFKENTLLFTGSYDSTFHDLAHPDSSEEFEWLDRFAWLYHCGRPFTQVEVHTIYTQKEYRQHKDSLAVQRAELLIDYLVKKGMPREIFVIKSEAFRSKRHINADGTRMKERDIVYFRIAAY